jgi:hypothetical protein
MGRYFRAPGVRATKQWRKVEMLYQAGVRFSGKQSADLGRFPDTLLEARAFVQRNRATLIARRRRVELCRAEALRNAVRRAEKRRFYAMRRKAQRAALILGSPQGKNA